MAVKPVDPHKPYPQSEAQQAQKSGRADMPDKAKAMRPDAPPDQSNRPDADKVSIQSRTRPAEGPKTK